MAIAETVRARAARCLRLTALLLALAGVSAAPVSAQQAAADANAGPATQPAEAAAARVPAASGDVATIPVQPPAEAEPRAVPPPVERQQLEEVIVTATKRESSVREIPDRKSVV
jgi:outer membrane receptor protein involved in Fe transport